MARRSQLPRMLMDGMSAVFNNSAEDIHHE